MPVLFAFREDRFGFRFEIGEGAVLGRSPDCDLILFDRATSRRHSEITQDESGYVLTDLGSTNGTYFNDERLEGSTPLKRNDEIRVGQEVFLFDPDLDVAVGREGAVLIVGDVDPAPDGAMVGPPETDLSALDRPALAPLLQIANALSNRPNKGRVLKQAAYALTKVFSASSICLLWPETSDAVRLTALLSRPEDQRVVLPRPLVESVIQQNESVIWPFAYHNLNFHKGERMLDQVEHSVMAAPLKAHGESRGLVYVESAERAYGEKELNFLTALCPLIGSALVNASLIHQLDYRLAEEEQELNVGSDFVGDDDQIKALLGTAYQVGQTDARILLTGEVGTGKEVLARRIHSQSHRRRGPFISVNCSLFAPGQLESALFGQEAGTVTEEGVPGLLEKADGGTIFIRHVDHLPLQGQVELLRTIEEGLVYRIGSSRPRPSDFRTITSTSADIYALIEQGEFREDLFQRLSEVNLDMPPLRELRGDIVTLAKHFLARAAKERGLAVPELDQAACECLQAYPWPGNVGELKNVVDRMVMFARGDRINIDDLPPDLRLAPEVFRIMDEDAISETMAEVEKIYIRRALARLDNNVEAAAEMLGISQASLEEMIQRYNIILDVA